MHGLSLILCTVTLPNGTLDVCEGGDQRAADLKALVNFRPEYERP
jgi:hypothetical protein